MSSPVEPKGSEEDFAQWYALFQQAFLTAVGRPFTLPAALEYRTFLAPYYNCNYLPETAVLEVRHMFHRLSTTGIRQQNDTAYAPDSPEELKLFQRWAVTTLDAQSGCNMSGLVAAFQRMIVDLQGVSHQTGRGTDWLNQHPLVLVFIDKLRDLSSNHSEAGRVEAAFDWVIDMAQQESPAATHEPSG
jgi:hypothetical protein